MRMGQVDSNDLESKSLRHERVAGPDKWNAEQNNLLNLLSVQAAIWARHLGSSQCRGPRRNLGQK